MSQPQTSPLPDGELRIFEPDADEGDLGRMYVLDVLGVSLMVHQRATGELYVHVDLDCTSTPVAEGKPLLVEVNNAGENEYT